MKENVNHKDNEIRALEVKVAQLDLENYQLRQNAVLYESNEAKLYEIQQLASIGSWKLDQVSGHFYCSTELANLLGTVPDAFSSWEDFLNIIPEQEKHDIDSALHASVNTQEPFVIEHRLMDGKGSMKHFKHYCKTFYAPTGMALSSVGHLHDITQLKLEMERREQIEAELRLSQKLEAVGQLSSGISHEINTPMQYLSNNIDFLKSAYDDYANLVDTYRKVLSAASLPDGIMDEIQRADEDADLDYLEDEIPRTFTQALEGVKRVNEIVQAMKELAHSGTSHHAPADLNRSLRNTITVTRNEYNDVAEVVTDLGDIPPVNCNIGEMNQVFINLLLNATQAIEESIGEQGEKGSIIISSTLIENEVEIRFQDSGCGIPEEIREKVFDPFFTTKDVGQGSGHGLSIARNIVSGRHSGSLNFESGPETGTTFIIRLPVS